MAWSGESWKPCVTRQVMQQKTAESLQNVMLVCCLCRWFIVTHDDIVSFALRAHNVHPFAIVTCTCIHARMPGFYMIPRSWAPPPFRHRYGIRILLAKHDAQPSPTQALKTELGELKLTLGNVQSKSSSETRGIVGLVVYGLGWESDDGNDVGPGEQGEQVCKGDRLMPDDLVFIWLRSQSVDNKLYKLPWFTSEVAWNAGQDR